MERFKEFLAEPRQRASELERARMQRVLKGGVAKVSTQAGSVAPADSVLLELRAVRSEIASLRDLLTGQEAPANDEILSRRQAADLLGWSVETVTKRAREDGLPHKLVGKEYRFLRSQVMAWLAARREALVED